MYSSLSCTLSPPICVGSFVEFFTISLYFVVSSFPLQFFYLSAMGAVHKVRHARGGGVREGVTVCDRKRRIQEHVTSGAPIPPETMMHFCPGFRIPPYFREISQTSSKIFHILPFPKNLSIFIRKKFW